MRTTVRLNDELLTQAKIRAAEEGRTLTSLIEEGLSLALSKSKKPKRKKFKIPTSKAKGGTLPGVDLNNWGDLEDLMEGR
ncbi:MAG: DUF2191 domain-containing protein [Candidatus Omnitrophica bacterium]|nr:DUF2191 domain-containing protein [Candidatus Omnitrophota bacterium]MCB9766576.1 DUF2191 domain-containing protein [Candidatus Omnitrophota bacterium]